VLVVDISGGRQGWPMAAGSDGERWTEIESRMGIVLVLIPT